MRRRRRTVATVVLSAAAALVLTGCPPGDGGSPEPDSAQSPPGSEQPPGASALALTSPDFDDGGPIPGTFTCAEAGAIPALEWTGVPQDAASLALTVLDPDAPEGTFAHWVIVDLDPSLTGFAEGRYPADATQAMNSAGIEGWFPPCPPSGDGPHRYQFTLWALDAELDQAIDTQAWEAVLAALEEAAGPTATLTGTVDLD